MINRIRVVAAVGRVTFFEILRDKVLYNIILCSFLLFGIGFLASRLSFTRPERVLIDFGMSALNISCAMIAAFTGAAMLGREFDRRTILVALSKPISRLDFVVGKFMGLAGILALNWALLTASFMLIEVVSTDAPDLVLNGTFAWAAILLLAQSWVIGAIAVAVSAFSTTSLAAVVTVGFYLLGNNVSQIRLVASRVKNPIGHHALQLSSSVLPNFEHFSLGSRVTYGLPTELGLGFAALAYAAIWIAIGLLAAGVLIQRREA